MKSYGYFGDLSPTGFFGASTKTFVIKFSEEVLGIPNPDGLVNAKVREAIKKLGAK